MVVATLMTHPSTPPEHSQVVHWKHYPTGLKIFKQAIWYGLHLLYGRYIEILNVKILGETTPKKCRKMYRLQQHRWHTQILLLKMVNLCNENTSQQVFQLLNEQFDMDIIHFMGAVQKFQKDKIPSETIPKNVRKYIRCCNIEDTPKYSS